MAADARVRYTKRVILENFLQLLGEKPIQKITVTEICRKAQINRATFYKHYEDVYDLLEKIEEEMVDGFQKSLNDIEERGTKAAVTDSLKKMQKYALDYLPIFSTNGDPKFAERLARMSSDRFAARINLPGEGEKAEKRKRVCYLYISSGSTGIVEQWIKEGLKRDPEEISDEIVELATATMRGLKAEKKDEDKRR